MCPCHIRSLDSKRKIMVLSHPYMEHYVVFPTRHGIRTVVWQARISAISCLGMMCLRPDDAPPLGSTSSWRSMPGSQQASYGRQKPQILGGRLSLLKTSLMSHSPCPLSISLNCGRMDHSKQKLYQLATSTFPCVSL